MIAQQKRLPVRTRIIISLCVVLVSSTIHAEPNARLGKSIYKKANCVGCHKWHGGGGGSYGGLALSLRVTPLSREALILVVRCGRPGTNMPYHVRQIYKGADRECYGSNSASLGDATPPRARYFLRDRDIEAVVDYVRNNIQGRGAPNYGDCVAFWGEEATRCKHMAQSKLNGERKRK